MAMDKDTLGALIVSKLKAADPTEDEEIALPKWTAVADAIITHILAAAAVQPGTFKDSTNAPITGTGTIT